MKRRDLMVVLSGAAIMAPVAVRAQQKPMPLLGYLNMGFPWPDFSSGAEPGNNGPNHKGLGEIGYVDAQDVTFTHHFAEGK
jgi:hypothetical protein